MPTEIALPVVTLVHAPACHFCVDADDVLAELAADDRIELRRVAIDSAEGQSLVSLHRPAMSPLVLLDGAFFSSGRLPRKKLTRALQAAIVATGPGAA